ncbi:MAG: carboxymuconolactone decarboxylase family protein [Micromonosporaceae bacterium]
MARISLSPPGSLAYRLARWYSRRKFGLVLDPAIALGHHPGVLRAYARYEIAAMRWRRVSGELNDLAVMAASARIGCAWCLDLGYWELWSRGLPAEKIRAVPNLRDSDLFTDTERLTLEYAEAVTATPPEVTDELVARLRTHFDDAQLVELTEMIALENVRSRVNSAFGLTGQGFAERCEAPR